MPVVCAIKGEILKRAACPNEMEGLALLGAVPGTPSQRGLVQLTRTARALQAAESRTSVREHLLPGQSAVQRLWLRVMIGN